MHYFSPSDNKVQVQPISSLALCELVYTTKLRIAFLKTALSILLTENFLPFSLKEKIKLPPNVPAAEGYNYTCNLFF